MSFAGSTKRKVSVRFTFCLELAVKVGDRNFILFGSSHSIKQKKTFHRHNLHFVLTLGNCTVPKIYAASVRQSGPLVTIKATVLQNAKVEKEGTGSVGAHWKDFFAESR